MRLSRKIMNAAALAAALAGAVLTAPGAQARTAAQPDAEKYFTGHIVLAGQDTFCLAYAGGEHPQRLDNVYVTPCRAIPEEQFLCAVIPRTGSGFCSPLAATAEPLALGQRGRGSRTLLVDYRKDPAHILQFIPRGHDVWAIANSLYSGRWMGTAQHLRPGRDSQAWWVKTSRGADVLWSTPTFRD